MVFLRIATTRQLRALLWTLASATVTASAKVRASATAKGINCDANASVTFVVASVHLPGSLKHTQVLARFQQLPSAVVLRAVDGANETRVIEALLESGLQFHNLSRYVRKWGKLATFLTKYQLLRRQVERKIPFQVMFEDDVVVLPPFRQLVQSVCDFHFSGPPARHPELLKMAQYAEILVTSLPGARRLVRKMEAYGIRKNDDQQLGDENQMGHVVRTAKEQSKELSRRSGHAWRLARKTNHGEITATRGMTWHEMALLRLLTNPAARSLPQYGMPVPLPPLACNYRGV